uniref:HMA domain-containing protein n=1 Tax=Kalanchoe fedtschenkoi TaxID=63787 RepID=A0A7N0TWZ6_KALFE
MKSCGAGGSGKKKMKMKMRAGFMCQTTMASVACMSRDNAVRSSSVVVPRKTSSGRWVAEHAKSSSCRRSDASSSSSSCSAGAKYMRLAESPNLNTSAGKQARGRYGAQSRSVASILSAPEPATNNDVLQVVVMKVSIHCQGCAGQVKKHLSKMEGVTSFSIDVETKRVIVMGHVSPAWVLASLSKVKKAELWTL